MIKKYGLTVDEYESMLAGQNNSCYICEEIAPEGKRLCIDHCHETGKTRKIICNNCNIALGGARDNIEILERLIRYLKEHGK